MQYLYRHFDAAGDLLYVGISLNSIQRLGQHKTASHWFDQIAKVEIQSFETREEAIDAEAQAIYNENPRFNLQRPTVKEQKKATEIQKENSEKDLLRRIVQFNPMYSMQQLTEILGVGSSQIKRWMDEGKLGFVVKRMSSGRWGSPMRASTGWQVIDFIDNWQKESTLIKKENTHGERNRTKSNGSMPGNDPAQPDIVHEKDQ